MHKPMPSRSVTTAVAVAAGALLVLAGAALAGWPSDPWQNLPICTEPDSQLGPTVVSDQQGGAVVVWYDYRLGAPDAAIYAQRFDGQGNLLWADGGVCLCAAPDQSTSPRAVSDGQGGAITVWTDKRNGEWDLYAQRVSADGEALWTPDGLPISLAPGDQYWQYPAIAVDGVGGAFIVWNDLRNDDGDIYAQHVNAAGQIQWQVEGIPICALPNWQGLPKVTTDDAGGAILLWEDERTGEDRLYAQRVTAAGEFLWEPDGVLLCSGPGVRSSHEILADGEGGAFVAWADNRTGQFQVYAQRLDASGNILWLANGLLVCAADGKRGVPELSTDGFGGVIIAWQDERDDDWGDLYAQRLDGSGTLLWPAEGVAVCTANDSQQYSVPVSDGVGGAVVVWQDRRTTGSYWDIYAQSVNADGQVRWVGGDGLPVSIAADHQMFPSAVSDGDGGILVAWEDSRNYPPDYCDIYAQRVYANGTLDGANTPTPTPSLSPTVTISPTPSVSRTATVSRTPTLSASPTLTLTATPSPTVSRTPSLSATPSLTPTPSGTPTSSLTTTATPSETATPTPIQLALWMPATTFAEGDPCALELEISNLGAARSADLYVLLDVFGAYWCYPSWQPLDVGLDFEAVTVPAGNSTLTLIPEFTMPTVSPCGPLYFYAAMFEPGCLDLQHLLGNGAVYEFSLGE